jgi:exodeoxyribonuclease VII large subunit
VSGFSQPSLIDPRDDAVSISALYDQVEVALARAFPKRRSIWVRGEIQSISDRTGHCYIDLIDPDGVRDRQSPVLKVKCWRTTWEPMSVSLGRQGIVLEQGMVVVIRGTLDFYKPRAELGFLLAEVDVAAILGRLAQKRAALLELLKQEGLLDLNKRLRVPDVPLRVGLVASSGTEGHGDFAGQLERSPYAFDVVLARASVQGSQAASSIAGALMALSQRTCDVVVIVRGGGSKADLATFDTEPVARAIAMMPVPVWVGIGHTGDQSVADIVSNRSFVTPTDCAKELVGRLAAWWESVASRALVLERRAFETLTDAVARDDARRHRLARCSLQQLLRHSQRLTDRADRLVRVAPRQVELAAAHLGSRAERVGRLCELALERESQSIVASRRLITAYDVDRQLERGYSLSFGGSGRLLRSVLDLEPGEEMTTRFSDGSARSTVRGVEPKAPDAASPTGEAE